MKTWNAVRVVGPVGIGLALVWLRPEWVSVATLGLLICVAVWLDGQERRADDVEDLEERMAALENDLHIRIKNAREGAVSEALAPAAADIAKQAARVDVLCREMDEHTRRLDALSRQTRGPIL